MIVSAALAETFQLKNDKVQFEVDDKGNLVSLKNLVKNREYAGGKGLWRIIYQDGLSIEESLMSEDVPVKVEKQNDAIVMSYGGDFPVKITCTLEGDEVRLVPELKNASEGKILREFQFPNIASVQLKKDTTFIWTYSGGEAAYDIKKWLRSGYTSYMGPDEKALQKYMMYPGLVAMNCFLLKDDDATLYVANLDPKFGKTLHLGRLNKKGNIGDFEYDGGVDFTMVKYPFLNPGESRVLPQYVLSPHCGDWRVSAKKYRKWADTWYNHRPITKQFENSNGWQRTILRHQYGKVLHPYSEIPNLYKIAAEAGFNNIRLYGWWKEGMDAGNPQYTEDDTQGGDAELKKQIAKVQAMGGTVDLYFNGQLIDISTDYYKKHGRRLSIKRSDGSEHFERYPFGGEGTALRAFGNKTFVTACPYNPEWLEMLKSFADRAIALGADGIYYDQIGLDSQPCYDKSHGHPVPFMEIMHAKSEMFKKVTEYVRSKKPGMTIGIEHVCDPVAQYVDYVHSGNPFTHYVAKDKFGKPLTQYIPFYDYAFPEFDTCDLSILDNRDIARRNNLSLVRSWRSDVSIFRCRATLNEVLVYKDYVKKINALRDKFRPLVLNGIFRHTDMATCTNPQIEYATYTNGDKMAVVATQSNQNEAKMKFAAEGYEFVEADGIGDWKAKKSDDGDSLDVELKRDAIVVCVFKKK